jgi:environmental stress-induced protein Ves
MFRLESWMAPRSIIQSVRNCPKGKTLIIIRKSAYKTTRWKNGGGVSHEALRVPAQADPFRWRISVAEVESAGPFSDFAGYQRKMTLLRGPGLRLKFANGQETCLSRVGDLAEFDGALATHCELLGGACCDLNLIVANSITDVRVRVPSLQAPLSVPSFAGESLVIFAVSGGVRVQGASGQIETLSAWDLAVINWPTAFDTMLIPLEEFTPARVFLANFKDA